MEQLYLELKSLRGRVLEDRLRRYNVKLVVLIVVCMVQGLVVVEILENGRKTPNPYDSETFFCVVLQEKQSLRTVCTS